MQGLTNGRIVHYVMRSDDYTKSGCYLGTAHRHHRPAIVVEDWGNGRKEANSPSPAVNLCVFPDGSNDGYIAPFWRTSVVYSENKEPGTWHWPEKE